MAEPTREELLAQIEELKQKAEGRRKGALEFRVGEKGASASMASAASRLSVLRAVGAPAGHGQGFAGISGREQAQAEAERFVARLTMR